MKKTAEEIRAEEQKELFRSWAEKYQLTKADFFVSRHFIIVRKSGILKMQSAEKIKIRYELVKCEAFLCCVKALGARDGDKHWVESYGSATPDNCKSLYYMEMAEKRARARVVLEVCGANAMDIFGEEEGAHE